MNRDPRVVEIARQLSRNIDEPDLHDWNRIVNAIEEAFIAGQMAALAPRDERKREP